MGIDFTVFKGSPNDGIVKATSHREFPTGNEVLVKITHSGICGTDEHFKHAGMVLGHEGVGTVERLGELVKGLKVGDIVGWGYTHKSCGSCVHCMAGEILRVILECRKLPTYHAISLGHDNYCTKAEMSVVSTEFWVSGLIFAGTGTGRTTLIRAPLAPMRSGTRLGSSKFRQPSHPRTRHRSCAEEPPSLP